VLLATATTPQTNSTWSTRSTSGGCRCANVTQSPAASGPTRSSDLQRPISRTPKAITHKSPVLHFASLHVVSGTSKIQRADVTPCGSSISESISILALPKSLTLVHLYPYFLSKTGFQVIIKGMLITISMIATTVLRLPSEQTRAGRREICSPPVIHYFVKEIVT